VFAVVVVGVEPPAEFGVELLGAVDIRDGDDDDLELHVDWRDAVSMPRTAFVLIAASCVVSFSCLHATCAVAVEDA
jgi:hypothetical protein